MDFFKIKKNCFIRLFFILLFLCIPTLWIVQESKSVQNKIIKKLITFLKKEWDSEISVQNYKINFFTGKISLKKGIVKNNRYIDKIFSWKFDSSSISFSRFDLLFKDNFSIDVVFNKIKVSTKISKNSLGIRDHLQRIMQKDSSVGVQLRSITINDIKIKCFYANKLFQNSKKVNRRHEIVLRINGNFCFKKFGNILVDNYWSGFVFVNDGFISVDKGKILENCKLQFIFSTKDKKTPDFTLLGNFLVPYLSGSKQYNLFSKKHKIYLSDELNKTDILFNLNDRNIKGVFSADFFNKFLPFMSSKSNVFGINLDYDSKMITGKFDFSKLNIPILGNTKISGDICLSGDKKDISIDFFDASIYSLNERKKLSLKLDLNNKRCDFKLFNITKKFPSNGTIFFIDNSLKFYAKDMNSQFVFDLGLDPYIYIRKILFINKGKRVLDSSLVDIDKKIIVGKISFSFIKNFLSENIKRSILSKSNFLKFNLNQSDVNCLTGSFELGGGKISILKNYNPIEKFNFKFLFNKNLNKLNLYNIYSKFFKGSISSKQGEIWFDDNFFPKKINIPIIAKNLLFNWKDNFYAILDGDLLYSKKIFDNSIVSGKITLKKSLVKGFISDNYESSKTLSFNSSIEPTGLFFDNFTNFHSDNINSKTTKFDIDILNSNSIVVRAGLFNFNVDLDLNYKFDLLNSNFVNQLLTGSININSGFLNFLDKKLYIQHGKVQFLPHRINDPVIDFVAKNKIKKYLISIQVAGSLNNPKIILKSFPKLHKQEILSLLLSGSSDGNLRSQLSVFLQKKLTDIVIYEKNTSFFKRLLNPFRYVQISPNFIDQSGKSGFKGSIDIDLSEQIHAQLQKDFNLRDDLSFQLDYFVSDDINFKFSRDQRGEVGAQVEVRFTL